MTSNNLTDLRPGSLVLPKLVVRIRLFAGDHLDRIFDMIGPTFSIADALEVATKGGKRVEAEEHLNIEAEFEKLIRHLHSANLPFAVGTKLSIRNSAQTIAIDSIDYERNHTNPTIIVRIRAHKITSL